MEPSEMEDHLLNRNLKQLVMFTGLDLTNNQQHNAIYNEFINETRRSAIQISYGFLTVDHELFQKQEKSVIKNIGGILKRSWPLKYLKHRPALIVCFVDIDWDQTTWLEKKTECESKINSLRQSIGSREIRLALMLIQKSEVNFSPAVINDKKVELCSLCKLNSKNLFVLSTSKNLSEIIGRFERAFYEISQEAYLVCLKRIRARSVPNNDPKLLIRQQYKLAFVSELRQDTHSALRYYKSAYQNISEFDCTEIDAYEILTVASILSYKICELCFNHNSAFDAVSQFQRHQKAFFFLLLSGFPSQELAAIEYAWWKSQQCRLFAELFERAVNNGLAAYTFQNPGRFLEEAAAHYRNANFLIKQLKSRLDGKDSPDMSLQSIDMSSSQTSYYGIRPWRDVTSNVGLSNNNAVTSQMIERAAKAFLEQNVKENYHRSLHLLSMTVAQFKRYNCETMQHSVFINMADDYVELHKLGTALQLLHRVAFEFRARNFRKLLHAILVKSLNIAYCMVNLNEYIWALVQLLNPNVLSNDTDSQKIVVNCCCDFMEKSFSVPPSYIADGSVAASFELATTQWNQYYNHSAQVSFSVEMSRLDSFLQCRARFLSVSDVVYSGDLLVAEVQLRNQSNFSLNFAKCILMLDELSQGKSHTNIVENAKVHFELAANDTLMFYFFVRPRVDGLSVKEKQIVIRKVALKIVCNEKTKANASFDFEFESPITGRQNTCSSAFTKKNNWIWWESTRLTVKVVPQKHSLSLTGAEKLLLLIDEAIDARFSLRNTECCPLKNIRIIANQIYKEDFQGPVTSSLASSASLAIINESGVLVPAFLQDFPNQLDVGEEISFAVRLSTKSANCFGVCTQILCQLETENGLEAVDVTQKFEVECKSPFDVRTTTFAKNNEIITSFIKGQAAVIEALITAATSFVIYSISWNVNSELSAEAEASPTKSKFTFSEPVEKEGKIEVVLLDKRECKVGDLIRSRVNITVPCTTATEFSIGDLILEWKGPNSCEIVRTIINLGQITSVSVPLVVSAQLMIHDENINPDGSVTLTHLMDCEEASTRQLLVVRHPFTIEFYLSSICDVILPLHVEFERSDVFVFSGFKEFSLNLLPGETFRTKVTMTALSAGQLLFPRLNIKCTHEGWNELINAHAYKSLPSSLYVLV